MSADYNADQFKIKLNALSAGDHLAKETVKIESLDMEFHLMELDASLSDYWAKCLDAEVDDPTRNVMYGSLSQLIVALTLVDSVGNRIFDRTDHKAQRSLGNLPSSVRDELAERCYALSKMRKKDREEAGKNLSEAPEDGSS